MLGSWWLDDKVSAELLRAWLAARIGQTNPRSPTLRLARQVAMEARVLEGVLDATGAADDPMLRPLETPPAKLIEARRLAPGGGRWLEQLAREGREVAPRRAATEMLLRHVEVERTQSLQLASVPPSSVAAWIERHAVATHFARQARRDGDVRLLNAALKLNDWAYPRHRRGAESELEGWYALALAEQELAFRQLTTDPSRVRTHVSPQRDDAPKERSPLEPRRDQDPLRVAVLAPWKGSLYARLVAWLASREPRMRVVGIVVRTPWTWARMQSELRRDGTRLLAKVYRKMVRGQSAYDPEDVETLGALARRASLPGRDLLELTRHIDCPVRVVDDANDAQTEDFLRSAAPDVIAFTGGGLVRSNILGAPRLGVLNCHMGVLPVYRGMDVVEWPFLEHTENPPIGLTLHFMDRGVDTGPILLERPTSPRAGDTFATLRQRFEPAMVELMTDGLRGLRDATLTSRPQAAQDGRQYFVMHDRLSQVAAKRLEGVTRARTGA
jgi:folate-dependent phosphoribosylglycinamide formyltransferase PurN